MSVPDFMLESCFMDEFVEQNYCDVHSNMCDTSGSCSMCEDGDPPKWRQSDGEHINICDMKTSHLMYTINMLTKNDKHLSSHKKIYKIMQTDLNNRQLSFNDKKIYIKLF